MPVPSTATVAFSNIGSDPLPRRSLTRVSLPAAVMGVTIGGGGRR
jgi:hypothetical protein